MHKVQEIHSPLLNSIMIFFTKLGDFGLLFLSIGLIFLFFKKYRKVGILIFLAQFINIIIVGLLKDGIQRIRPFLAHATVSSLVTHPISYSFPSGHASSAFAGAVIIGYYFKKWSIPAYIVAFLIAFSRIYVGVHYPTDVIIGTIIGILSSIVAIILYEKYLKKIFYRPLKKLHIE